jgi:TPR repeat protein
VPRDYARARQWFEKSIAQGNAPAQFYIGWLYANGLGVPQDLVHAHLWMSLAAAQGNEIAAQERDKVASRMTSAQISEAQRLAQQCQAQQFKGC